MELKKLKPIKNKKVIYILFALAAVLLLGITANLVKNIGSSDDMCEVVINYNVVDADGNSTRFDTYREEHPRGERINVVSPKKSGYTPDKQNVIAVVKSDMVFNVNYSCVHVYTEVASYDDMYHFTKLSCASCGYETITDKEEHNWHNETCYPDEDNYWSGYMWSGCYECEWSHEYQMLERIATFTFGGDVLTSLSISGQSANGYLVNSGKIVRLRSDVPGFDDVCSGVQDSNGYTGYFPYGDSTLNKGIKVELEYDETVWGENAIAFKYLTSEKTDSPYSISCGDSWRFIFRIEEGNVDHWDWISEPQDCPLIQSPITIKVTTYYFE